MTNKYMALIFAILGTLAIGLALAKTGNVQAVTSDNTKDKSDVKKTITAPVAPFYGRYFAAPYYGYGRNFAYPYYGYNRYFAYPYYGGYNRYFAYPYYGSYYASPYYGYGWNNLYVTPWWWH